MIRTLVSKRTGITAFAVMTAAALIAAYWSPIGAGAQSFTTPNHLATYGGFGDAGQYASQPKVEVASNGDVYVLSQTGVLRRHDAAGNVIWANTNTGIGANSVGMALDENNGVVYASLTTGDQVKKFSTADGSLLLTFGSTGTGNGQFDSPMELDVDASGNVYVADTGNARVQKFDSSGNFLAQFGSSGTGTTQFDDHPRSVHVRGGTLYVGEYRTGSGGSGRVHTLDLNLNHTGIFISGVVAGRVTGLDSDASNFYVSAASGHRVQRYDLSGTFVNSIGSFGTAVGTLNSPRDVSVSPSGNVFIESAQRIQEFTPAGTFVATYHGSEDLVNGLFNTPSNMHIDAGGVHIADRFNYRVQTLSDTGTFVRKFGSLITDTTGDPARVNQTFDVVRDSAGNYYVSHNHFITKWDANGNFIGRIVSQGFSGGGAVGNPAGLAIAPNVSTNAEELYVSDSFGIQVFDLNGNFLREWAVGSVGGGFHFDIEADSQGNIWGANRSKARLDKYDQTGTLLLSVGGFGTGPGQFSSNGAVGLGIDSNDNVYAVDKFNSRVQVFDNSGTFLGEWGTNGTGNGQFLAPQDVEVDASGNIFVIDDARHDLQKFAISEPLTQCTIDALAAMGLNPGDFPNLESELDDACEASPDNVTTIEAGSEPSNNIRLDPNEVIVLGEGASIDNNIIGDNNSENALYLGSNVTISNNSLKTEAIWVGGTGNLIQGNVNHEVDINVGPNAFLRVDGNINDLQNLNIGPGGTLDVGGNVDIWVSVDIGTGGLLNVDGTLDCNGAPSVNNNGTVTAGTNNCTLLAVADTGGSGDLATYLPLLALAALGLAVYVRPKK